ncbi:hypothetical protein [Ferruginibacter sp. SUN106]|uniref:hypothetical protein n=1 Tax=Ferruginibacter sp. SUN106 TaxID=2978348 RepID=UPI003D36460F
MNLINKEFYKTNVTLRITALWAFSEAFMGGILHGLQIPFAGLVLSFVASVCITLIALGNNKKGEILKATLLVIAVKFILSPHTPPMAYVAVLIQGAVGELLFLNRSALKPAAFILTLFSLLYSAFQHLLILTIVFGKGFWQAIDIFLNKITQSFIKDAVHYSLYIILFYVGCYLVAGIVGGILNIKIIKSVQAGNRANALLQQLNNLPPVDEAVFTNERSAKRKKWFAFIFGSLMLLMLVFSYLPFFSNSFSKSKIAELIIRAVIIVLVWNYFITPLLRLQIQKWVARYKEKNGNALQQVIALLPGIKIILQQSWQLSQQPGKWLRFKSFINNTVLLIVHHEQ